MTTKAALWGLMAALVIVCGYACLSNAEPRKITEVLRRGLSQVLRRVWTPKQRTAGLTWVPCIWGEPLSRPHEGRPATPTQEQPQAAP